MRRMGDPFSAAMRRRLRVLVACAALAACGGSAQNGAAPASTDDLACLGSLAGQCCSLDGSSTPCLAEWSTATLCTSWPAGTPLSLFSSPCQGMRAIRVKGASYSSFFVYQIQSGMLLAIGDNAALDPGSNAIACGAGPVGFTVPAECAQKWLGTSGAAPCDPTVGKPVPSHDWCGTTNDGGAD